MPRQTKINRLIGRIRKILGRTPPAPPSTFNENLRRLNDAWRFLTKEQQAMLKALAEQLAEERQNVLMSKTDKPLRLRWRVVAVPMPLRLLLLLPALALPAYWWSTYSGLYRWFAGVQLRRFGSYEATQTVGLCVIVCLLVSAVLLFVLGLRRRPELGASSVRPDRVPPFDAHKWLARMRAHPVLLVAVIGAFGSLGAAGYFLVDGITAGSLSQTTALALEAGEAPPSRYTVLEGRRLPSPSVAVETESNRRKTTTVYLPIVSSHWTERLPVAVFLGIERSALERLGGDLGFTQFRGVLTKHGLPGPARTQLENEVATTSPYWVLEYGASPEESFVAAGATGMIGIMFGCIALFGWRRIRRRSAAAEAEPAPSIPGARVL